MDLVLPGIVGAPFLSLMFWLFVGHSLGDFALQTDWTARFKSRHANPPIATSKYPNWIWIHVLASHSAIHGGLVALITGSIWLGLAEFVAHAVIDFCKSESYFGFNTDQLLHLGCKLLWGVLLFSGLLPG